MVVGRKKTGQEKARQYLLDLIGNYTQENKVRLPTIPELAREAGVSPVTLRRAMVGLKKASVIRVSHGSGITITGKSGTLPPLHTPEPQLRFATKWQKTAWQLEQDILRGKYPSGSLLPPTNSLLRRYGISFRTCQKVQNALLLKKLIEPFRNSYRVVSLEVSHASASIALIALLMFA